MDIQSLTRFFLCCTIINGSLFAFWVVMLFAAPELVYRTQRRWFPHSRESFSLVMYGFLGLFKIFFLVFNVVPLVALLIIGGNG